MLSEKEKILFILRNPVALYKTDSIEAEPRDGMEITFSTENFEPTQLLSWKRYKSLLYSAVVEAWT